MVSFLIAYASWSGNTQEVAEIIEETMMESGIVVTTVSNRRGHHSQSPQLRCDAYRILYVG